ncbi:MAG: Membrane-bound lytic murein transglycosylase D [Olavius algarvensis Delta 4 endosymbiont]|nr:MAG: Membrane-bound lytic murein transglycosylase D [Olavius algarvensis Delta 4 endosymbiont]
MANLFRLILLLIVLPLFYGCNQTVIKSNLPNNTQPPIQAEEPEAPGSPVETVQKDESAPAATEPDQPAELPEAIDTEATLTENGTPANGKVADDGKKIEIALDEALDFIRASHEFWQAGELDNALEALDKAYSLVLDVDTAGNPKLIQQKEDLRFLISKRILEIYASRHIVVNGNHKAIPMDMNRHIQAEIKRFTNGERKFFIESYRRSGMYRPAIVAALQEAGLPTELSWLPLIESGFKSHALSKARALGLWQFIPSTGYKFGLKRTTYLDERLDPAKSTRAAVAYLKELHQIFGDWTTVLAAYNCGEGRVLRVIRTQNVNYLDNFWDLYIRLPLETARYVPRFLATLHILQDPEKYGMTGLVADPPLEYDTVQFTRRVHLKDVASAIGSNYKQLKVLNPELRYKITPDESYTLRVPTGKGNLLLTKINTLPITSRPQPAYVYHRVRPGESLSVIARRYRTSVSKIMRANNIRRSHFIRAGKKLKIPTRGVVVTRTPAKSPAKVSGPVPSRHVVKSGDSLWIIAKRYGTTTREIQQLNGLQGPYLSIGQVLKIPGKSPQPASKAGLKAYKVKYGDSPFKIAQLHNMDLKHFLKINQLTPRTMIFPGQTLYVD